FAGGWTLEAAEAVCATSDCGDQIELLNLLTGLVDKSLVVADDTPRGIRFYFLETIRAYAEEHLGTAGEAEPTRGRHLAWCLALAEQAEPELLGARQVEVLAALEDERPNLRVALG